MKELPDFRSELFLRAHIRESLSFYHPRALDPDGGFFHYFKDDGTIYDPHHRHLVSSARFVYIYAMAGLEFNEPNYLDIACHGLRYLRQRHRDPETGGYCWTINHGMPEDLTNHCYGIAFVLLAYATSYKAGVVEAKTWMDETWNLLEKHFWERDSGLYRDEADYLWQFSGYRGQNANMHMCEAMLAAYEATGDQRFLDRSLALAEHLAKPWRSETDGLIWEHYDQAWEINWDYHREQPQHLFRPWGYQTGHQTEWAKLLLMLHRHYPLDWLILRAEFLFSTTLELAWDHRHGGIFYSLDRSKSVCDADKYFWVQAETLSAAALSYERTGEETHWRWYDRIWAYAWHHFIDHQHGAWYRILKATNAKYDDCKSPSGKTDYHTMGACYESLRVLRNSARNRVR